MLCNSWVIVHRTTGEAILETYNPRVVAAINIANYEVLTAYEWLVRFNRAGRAGRYPASL